MSKPADTGTHTPLLHPSRTAPLCVHCYHSQHAFVGPHLMCNHPSAPVSPIDGVSVQTCEDYRHGLVLNPGQTLGQPMCGPSGRFFTARRMSPADMGERVRGMAPLSTPQQPTQPPRASS